MKKTLEISSIYTFNLPKIMIICYTVPDIWCMTDVIVIFIFFYIFPFYPPNTNNPKNENFKTMKKAWFTQVYQK